jgi:hypothetical protein
VLNATFNNISVISWRAVLLVEETGVPGENPRPAASQWQTMLYTVPWSEFELTTSVVIGTGCIGVVVNPTTVRLRPRRPPPQLQWYEGAKKDQHSSLMSIGFSSPRFQESQKEPKPKFSAIFPLNVIVIIFAGIWQGVKIGQIPKSNLCHCFSLNSFENAIDFVVFSVLEILEDQGPVQGLL